jgi:hypothetical protein
LIRIKNEIKAKEAIRKQLIKVKKASPKLNKATPKIS